MAWLKARFWLQHCLKTHVLFVMGAIRANLSITHEKAFFFSSWFLEGYGKRCWNQASKEAWTGEKGNWFVIFFLFLMHGYSIYSILSTSRCVCFTAALKDRGNEAYAKEDYETAVKYYTDGLTELRDMQPLYTNRAQVNFLFLNISLKSKSN